MKEIMTVFVDIKKTISIEYKDKRLQVIHFSGEAKGSFFTGQILREGLDTQVIDSEHMTLSARYILEGHDYTDSPCKVYIENQGPMDNLVPKIFTDSSSLAFLHQANLKSTLEVTQSQVIVTIWQVI